MAATFVGRRASKAVSQGRCLVPWIIAGSQACLRTTLIPTTDTGRAESGQMASYAIRRDAFAAAQFFDE